MRIRNCRQYFIDTLGELAGIKSGLALSDEQIIELSGEKDFIGPKLEGIVVRAECLEEIFVSILYELGVIADRVGFTTIMIERLHDFKAQLGLTSIEEMMKASNALQKLVMNDGNILDQDSHYEDLTEFIALQKEIASIMDVPALIKDYRLRSILDDSFPEDRSWDGQIPLDKLFSSEEIPKGSTDSLFDQRYIDFLNAQPERLTEIHWRQFEYLTGEFFQRRGYKVTITPPRNDGGIDVIAEKDDEILGPSLVLAQCKRHGDNNPVEIDSVKAFYQTMADNKATRGLFATTSVLEHGAKKWCNARKHQIAYNEGKHVQDWIKNMANPSN